MARRLALGLGAVPGVTVTQSVDANAVFAILPRAAIAPLQAVAYFHVWDEPRNEVRLMASFDTTPDDVDRFVEAAARIGGAHG
jgi:threonine aldolase